METQGGIDRLSRKLNRFFYHTGWISGSIALIMTLAITREVGGRYIFNYPSDWVVDVSALLFAALVYLGAGYTTSVDAHVRADFIYRKYTGRTKNVMDILIYLICSGYTIILVWQGWSMAWEALVTMDVTTGGVRWPIFPFKVTVPLGATLALLVFVIRIIQSVRDLIGEDR